MARPHRSLRAGARGAPARALRRRPTRGSTMVARAGDLVLDYSKHRVDAASLAALVAVARRAGVAERRDAMFAGRRINTTEDRAVLHVALRMPRDAQLLVEGHDVVADVHAVLDAMGTVAERIRSGAWTGQTGDRIRAVVNIGIGGSDLGPAMAHEALRDYADPSIECRFVSNVDPVDLYAKTRDLDPAVDPVRRLVQDVHHPGDADERPGGPAPGCSRVLAVATRPCPVTSWPCRPTGRGSPRSASTPPTCSASGTGSAVATPTTRPSGSR